MIAQFRSIPGVAVCVAVVALACIAPTAAQVSAGTPASGSSQAMISGDNSTDHPSGCITGTVVDQSGAVVVGAQVHVTRSDHSASQDATTGTNGQFFVANVTPGAFDLTVTASGFGPGTYSGVVHAKEIDTVPSIILAVASSTTAISVGVTREEIAEDQIRIEEHQRVLGVIPNFYVSYNPHAVPLSPRQKFQLAEKTVIDPFTFVIVAGTAGVEQWQNHFIGYGQGTEGYAKRFGANYADTLTGTFIGGAILPSLLKQDPRYFYKGTGGVRARFLYAVAMSFVCKGDNGHWQPNYSGILGSLAAGGISNLYYPAADRDSAALTFDNTAIGIGSNAISNLFQEFLIPKLTPNKMLHHDPPPQPQPQ
ncbi:MAG TPA: carboxypeptidase-like regulatory domain-containing protein [Candidatus Binatia bacterium]|nr:carboxypeptidase-like regulatory domain-containing protein [Candidatus Binatia bacterium]